MKDHSRCLALFLLIARYCASALPQSTVTEDRSAPFWVAAPKYLAPPTCSPLAARPASSHSTTLQTLQPRAVNNFDSRVAFSTFSADGKRLLVLSANQTIYPLDTAAH
jgi:hypothetical protein